MLSFALHDLWICGLLSPCDSLWHWQAWANSVCKCDWPLLCSPLSSVGGVISDSFTAPRLFRERDTRGGCHFYLHPLFSLFLSPSLKRRIFVTTAPPPSTPLKTRLLGLIMIKVIADRALRGNINHTHYILDILLDLETNNDIPCHFTFISLQCLQMSCLTMIHSEDQITLGNSTHSLRCGGLNPFSTEAGKQNLRHIYSILLTCFDLPCPFDPDPLGISFLNSPWLKSCFHSS